MACKEPRQAVHMLVDKALYSRIEAYARGAKRSIEPAIKMIMKNYLDLHEQLTSLDLVEPKTNKNAHKLIAGLSDLEVINLCHKHKVTVCDDLEAWLDMSMAKRAHACRAAYAAFVEDRVSDLYEL